MAKTATALLPQYDYTPDEIKLIVKRLNQGPPWYAAAESLEYAEGAAGFMEDVYKVRSKTALYREMGFTSNKAKNLLRAKEVTDRVLKQKWLIDPETDSVAWSMEVALLYLSTEEALRDLDPRHPDITQMRNKARRGWLNLSFIHQVRARNKLITVGSNPEGWTEAKLRKHYYYEKNRVEIVTSQRDQAFSKGRILQDELRTANKMKEPYVVPDKDMLYRSFLKL